MVKRGTSTFSKKALSFLPMSRVGWCCTYVPIEIIEAVGLEPSRIVPSGRIKETVILDPNFCPYVKSVLGSLETMSLRGLVLVNSCDGMKRLYDAVRFLFPWVSSYMLDVPKRDDEGAVAYFSDRLKGLYLWLKETLGGEGTIESLRSTIAKWNKRRKALEKALEKKVRKGELLRLLKGGTFEEEELEALETLKEGRKGILVTGSLLEAEGVLDLIEEMGFEVVFLDVCSGIRSPSFVPEDLDPFYALASAYLSKPPCARMKLPSRKEYIKAALELVDGVIVYTPKFCDQYLHELLVLRKLCGEKGLPLLHLETDYNQMVPEMTNTRVMAFLERWL